MAKVEVQIVGDSSSLHKSLNTATSGTSKLGSVMGHVATIAAGFGLALGAEKVLEFGKDSINAAAQVQKSTEAIRADFGHAADRVLSFGESAAKSFGISNASSTAFSAQLGITAKNIGLAHDKAATMSIGLQKLAGSIGLIKGEDPTSVFHSLTLALAGNTRGLKAMGVVVTPLNEQLEAQRLGFIGPKGTISSLTAAQKAQVIYGIATKHLSEFQKEAKKHTGDLADQQILLKAQLSNVADELGAALLPALTKVTGWMAKNLPVAIAFVTREWAQHRAQVMKVIDAITQAVEKNLPEIEATIRRVWAAISAVTKKVWPIIRIYVTNAINIIGDILHIAMDLIQGRWGAAWGKVKALVKDAMTGMVRIIRAMGSLAASAAAAVGSAILHGISRGLSGIAHLVSRAMHSVVNAVGGVIGAAENAAASVGRAIMQGIANGISSLAGWLESQIASMAEGLLHKAMGILHINSPSLVFSDVIGRGIMEGIAHGINKHASLPHDALANALMPQGGGMAGAGATRHGIAGGRGGTEVIQLVLDRKVLSEVIRDMDKNYRRQNNGRPLLSGA